MALKHFAHEHTLDFAEDVAKAVYMLLSEDQKKAMGNISYQQIKKILGNSMICERCDENVRGSSYCCNGCLFCLHKSCAEDELPHELHHPIHPKHPLILFTKPPYDEKACTCNGCNQPWRKFVYHCAICKFDLDIKCAFLPLIKEAEVHEHPLTLVRKSMLFTCDVCGQKGKGLLFLCASCPFLVDVRCASLPHTVKHIRHNKHPLKLTYSLQLDKSNHLNCQLCVNKIDIDYGVYFCSSCNFVAHLHCATDKEGIDDIDKSDVQDTVPNDQLTTDLDSKDAELDESIKSSYVVKKVDVGGDGNEMDTEIKHFSHEHDLVLTYNELDNNEKCDACRRPLFPPTFSCAKCGFYLHKWCAELPKKKRHPLHKHPLILKTNMLLRCSACSHFCHGLTYCCEECPFFLDVQCSSISNNLTHEGHEHPFVLSNKKGKCNACGKDEGYLFHCGTCDFTLNFGCATLPHMMRHESHKHPFILTYHTVDDGSDEYYCDICEELRDPKDWYYCCAQCDYPAHPKCILGEDPNLKFGVIYNYDIVHQHPLTLVRWTKDQYLCDRCGLNHGSSIGFKCTECNFNIHDACLISLVSEKLRRDDPISH